jgi:hypothetical protein
MWGTAPMTELKAHCDIRPFEKSIHRLVVSSDKKVKSSRIRANHSGAS